MKNLTWQNPEQLFVAQELINKVKSKCCGIKVKQKYPNKKIDFQKVSKEETLESSQTAYNVLLQIYLFVWKTSFEGMKSKTYIRFC